MTRKLRPILAGEGYVRAVQGGVISSEAPEDGAVFDHPDEDVFLTERELKHALWSLRTRRQKARQSRKR